MNGKESKSETQCPEGKYRYRFPHPAVTVDCVLFGVDGDAVKVLLIRRAKDPFAGSWAFPGGFVGVDESAECSAVRELWEETGISGIAMEQLHTFSAPGRDPRERVISIAFMAVVDQASCKAKAGDDAEGAEWFALDNMPPLAFDHAQILSVAESALRHRLADESDPCGFVQPWIGGDVRARVLGFLAAKR